MKRSEILLMILQVPIDFLMLILAGFSAYLLRFSSWAIDLKPVIFDISMWQFLNIVGSFAIVWVFIFAILGLYSVNPNRRFAQDLLRVIFACFVGLCVIALYIMLTNKLFDSRFLVISSWVFAMIYVIFGRFLVRGLKALLYRLGIGLRRVVIIGSENISKIIVDTLGQNPRLGYKIVQVYDTYNNKLNKELLSLNLNEIIFVNPRAHEEETLQAKRFCDQNHIVFKYSADVFSTYSTNMSVYTLAGVPIVELKKTSLDGWGRISKRIFDIVMSLIILVLVSPLMLLTTFVILIETGRPIIYKNERIGIRGMKFLTLKFRSMYQKDSTGAQFGEAGFRAEEKEKELINKNGSKKGPIYKIANDPRVTPFGRVIRRFSIDELPQFFNVLVGNMSIVGPRPHQPREVEKYVKNYPDVFVLKPGITGLSQISGRSDLSFQDEMKLDIFYTEKWNLYLDFIIFFKTPFILFRKRKVL
ncbi:MAG: sugar transferase [Candidatus Magasanikbacteria bacterium]